MKKSVILHIAEENREVCRAVLVRVLNANHGEMAKTAETFGVSSQCLRSWISELKIESTVNYTAPRRRTRKNGNEG